MMTTDTVETPELPSRSQISPVLETNSSQPLCSLASRRPRRFWDRIPSSRNRSNATCTIPLAPAAHPDFRSNGMTWAAARLAHTNPAVLSQADVSSGFSSTRSDLPGVTGVWEDTSLLRLSSPPPFSGCRLHQHAAALASGRCPQQQLWPDLFTGSPADRVSSVSRYGAWGVVASTMGFTLFGPPAHIPLVRRLRLFPLPVATGEHLIRPPRQWVDSGLMEDAVQAPEPPRPGLIWPLLYPSSLNVVPIERAPSTDAMARLDGNSHQHDRAQKSFRTSSPWPR